MGHGSAIDLAGHKEFFPLAPEDIPYYQCFRDVVHKCGEWSDMVIPKGTVKFTFDQWLETNYNAGMLYNYMPICRSALRASDNLFPDISFASRKLPAIQIVDLCASSPWIKQIATIT